MIRLKNIQLKTDNPHLLRIQIGKILGTRDFTYEVYRKSIDARKGILFNYQVLVEADIPASKVRKIKDASYYEEEDYSIEPPHQKSRVLIVGSGPAGFFCAYILAQYGSKPIIIEQGQAMEERIESIQAFLAGQELNLQSNVQFGEGGAGTFSDGKLTARSKDQRLREVLKIFVAHGAPAKILYEAKPHIGTDLLRQVIVNMRQHIIDLGGEFHFSSTFEDLDIQGDQVKSFTINQEKHQADRYVLALGNSARESFELLAKKIPLANKPFAVGFRIEHKREFINERQYKSRRKDLPTASYSMSYRDQERAMSGYTFCMCPGGYVINAASEAGGLVVNGMSFHDRDGENSNAAIIVTVDEKIYGQEPLAGMHFQQRIEAQAFDLGGGDYRVPVQRLGDFRKNQASQELGSIQPTVRPGYRLANLRGLYPEVIDQMIIDSLQDMDRRIPGFAMDDAILSGVETRTSSPVRMVRDVNLKAQGLDNLYVIGEGSGYAGGIMSSAIDGIKAAEKIIQGK